jgi:hypothetical protein
MYISTVLNFDRFVRGLHQAPKFALDVILRHAHVAKRVGCWIVIRIITLLLRGVCLEPPPAKFAVACLKTRQGMFLSLVESKIAPGAEYASWAKPLPARHRGKLWVQAEHVKSWGDVK